jgi:hypothetical protein
MSGPEKSSPSTQPARQAPGARTAQPAETVGSTLGEAGWNAYEVWRTRVHDPAEVAAAPVRPAK